MRLPFLKSLPVMLPIFGLLTSAISARPEEMKGDLFGIREI